MKKTILMVDDEPDQLYMVKEVFSERFGESYSIKPVEGGKECFDYLEHNALPDLILLDIMMPGMNGLEIQRKLKEHSVWKNIPIVFLTARGDSFSQKVGSVVSEEYVVKPINVEYLKNKIDAILNFKNIDQIQLTPLQIDTLQEVTNIGALHAATALSKMVDKEINISIPKLEFVPLEKTVNSFKEMGVSIGIYMKISDDFPTYVLLLLKEADAYALIDLLFDERPTKSDEYLLDMYKSALQEVGDVMMSSFVKSISDLLKISVLPGPTFVAHDDPIAIMDVILIQLGQVTNDVVMFNVDLNGGDDTRFHINMFLLPEPKTIELILENLQMK